MKYYQNILETIGKTPLVRLNKVTSEIKATILAKVEYFNPGGSVKDRIGIAMIEEAEKKGLLKEGGTIVEPTSGNTGIGLALAAAQKGYKAIFTMPEKMSKEKELILRAFGAEVVRTPSDAQSIDDPKGLFKITEKILKETPDSFCPHQYFNQKNPEAHYQTTGPEIWRDTDGKITHFVAGMGTGGTITGIGRYLKEKNPNAKIIGVDPEGSIFHHRFYKTKEESHGYKIEGIGEPFMPETLDLKMVDEIITVNDKEAYSMARRLAREEGLLVGSSSGAAVVAALRAAKDLEESDLVVVLLPDTGRNYLSTIFNDEWLRKNGLL